MTDTEQLHWKASGQLLRSTVTGNENDRDSFFEHVFAHNSPLEHEVLLTVFFGMVQKYFESLGDLHGSNNVEELWLGLWSDWKDMTSTQQRIEQFHLLETIYIATVKGTFVKEATNRNSTSQIRQALVTMASLPGFTGIHPTVACMFLSFAFDLCDEGKAPIFRRTMKDAVEHILK